MEKKNRTVLYALTLALSVLSTLAFTGFRFAFIFVDNEVFNGFVYLLWGLFILNTIHLFWGLRAALAKGEHYKKPVFIINAILAFLSLVTSIAFLIIGGKAEFLNYIHMSAELLPYLGGFYLLLFLLLVFPLMGKFSKSVFVALGGFGLLTTLLVFLFPPGGFAFKAEPAVFITEDSYAIVFATNRKSVGFVSYEFEGQEYTLHDTTKGRKDSSTVHSIKVPFEHLDNNSYRIGARRVWEDTAYGGHLGKTIEKAVGMFTPCPSEDFTALCVTDNHGFKADWVKLQGKGDTVFFLGDVANAIYRYESFVDNLIIPAGLISLGQKPSVYVRGNHDHRGPAVRAMLEELDFGSYNFRFEIGDYNFIVLDTGEDKDDDNFEYAGFNDYLGFFAEQDEWLLSLEPKTGYNIALAHCPTLFHEHKGQKWQTAEILEDLGVNIVIGGDFHQTEYVDKENSSTGIAYYICGCQKGMKDLWYTTINFKKGVLDIASFMLSDGSEVNRAKHELNRVTE
ncbi:MAG: hypothetical protein GX345_04530 [Clostridiales bacterium]|nr:hypothetical protein [Clostridiales bacterium]